MDLVQRGAPGSLVYETAVTEEPIILLIHLPCCLLFPSQATQVCRYHQLDSGPWVIHMLCYIGGFFGKIAQVSGSLGGEKNSPATTYPCTVEDNKVFLDIN